MGRRRGGFLTIARLLSVGLETRCAVHVLGFSCLPPNARRYPTDRRRTGCGRCNPCSEELHGVVPSHARRRQALGRLPMVSRHRPGGPPKATLLVHGRVYEAEWNQALIPNSMFDSNEHRIGRTGRQRQLVPPQLAQHQPDLTNGWNGTPAVCKLPVLHLGHRSPLQDTVDSKRRLRPATADVQSEGKPGASSGRTARPGC